MSYDPKPLDTSDIHLGSLEGLQEYLAEQAHESWARQRMDEGWVYGLTRDDENKTHPNLVPYAELTESEKDYDRLLSAQTLKLIVHSGFELQPKASPIPSLISFPGYPEVGFDDMNDDSLIQHLRSGTADEQGETPSHLMAFIDQLEFIKKKIVPTFQSADRKAVLLQKVYLISSFLCVILVALAVALAVFQLLQSDISEELRIGFALAEGLLVLLAVTLVILSSWGKWHEGWLINRHIAERCRELKFRFLLNPDSWESTLRPRAVAQLVKDLNELNSTEAEQLPCILTRPIPQTAEIELLNVASELETTVLWYYWKARLEAQATYFGRKAHWYHKKDAQTKIWAMILFFSVLLFVFAHDFLDVALWISHNHDKSLHNAGRWLIGCAAAVPAIGAAIHVFRSGREYGRNYLRTAGAHSRLNELQLLLGTACTRKEQIKAAMETETTLASEHRQWLQLMAECEWFG